MKIVTIKIEPIKIISMEIAPTKILSITKEFSNCLNKFFTTIFGEGK